MTLTDRKLRILFANSFYAPEFGGGAEMTLHRLACALTSRGHAVAAFTTGERECIDLIDGVTVYRFPIDNTFRKLDRDLPNKLRRIHWQWRDRKSLLMAERLDSVIHQFRPDVIQFHNIAGLTSSIWAVPSQNNVASVQTLHDLNLICPNSSMFKNGHSCARQCTACAIFRAGFGQASQDVDALVGVSHYVLNKLATSGYFTEKTHRVIYNNQSFSPPPPLPDGPIVRFGYIGGLTSAKGLDWLIDQFDSKMGTLFVAGSGPAEYVAKLQKKGEGKPITFLGSQNPAEFFRSIDISIVPSIWNDTLPGVAIEAGAFGRPAIVSRRGGLPEIIVDGVSGLLVDPDLPDSLGAAMTRLAADRDLRLAMATAAPTCVAKFTDPEGWTDEYVKLYHELIANRAVEAL